MLNFLYRMISCLMRRSESEHTSVRQKSGGKFFNEGSQQLSRSKTLEPVNQPQLIPLGTFNNEGQSSFDSCTESPCGGSSSSKSKSGNKLAYVFKNVYHSMRNILSKSPSFSAAPGKKSPSNYVISGKDGITQQDWASFTIIQIPPLSP